MKIKRNSHYRWGACRAMDRVVAQVSNLLYRRASSLRVSRSTRRNDDGNVLPIGNRRYSRLETCATPNWPDFVNGAPRSRALVPAPSGTCRKIKRHSSQSGIALIMVMLIIVVLAALAARFAFTMKVETKLARNASFDAEFEWLGRSGVELARYVIAQEGLVPGGGQVDSLNQKWAGGPGASNSPVAEIPLDNYQLGIGSFSVKIVDCDRKFNINVADEVILRQAMTLIGVDAGSFATIVDSILDWRDPDDKPRMAGAESDFYQKLADMPHFAKDGPLDDLSELLMVNGVTTEMYWGSHAPGHVAVLNRPKASRSRFEEPIYEVGLADLFTTTSSRMVNINTASAKVLQIFPEIDENIANAITTGPGGRAGPDGAEGTDDDTPFRSVQELARIPGIPPNAVAAMSRYFTVRSLVFEATVQARIGNTTRTYIALLRRLSPRDIQIMSMYWK